MGDNQAHSEPEIDLNAARDGIASIRSEIDVMQDKFSWWDWIGVAVLALGVVTACGAAIAAALGLAPVTVGGSVAAGIVACLVMIWWFVDHCLDVVDATEEMLNEQDAIRKKLTELEKMLGISGK